MEKIRIILDGNIVNAVDGWDQAKIKLFRDDTLKGLLLKYVTDLTFTEDGYDILYNAFNSVGTCASVDFIMQKLINDSYTTIFTGIIYLDSAEFNEANKTVKVSPEENGLSGLILKYKSVEVRLNQGQTFAGSSLSYIGQDCRFHDQDTGNLTYATRPVYLIRDVIQHYLDIITDNQMVLNSDFFGVGNDCQEDIQTATLDADFVAGNVIDLRTKLYNTTEVLYGTTFNTDHQTTFNEVMAFGFPTTVDEDSYERGLIYLPRWNHILDQTGIYRVMELKSFLPFTITNFTVSGGASQPNITVARTQSYTDQMGFLALTNGSLLSGTGFEPPLMSFDTLISELNKYFGVIFKIYDNAGTPTFKIEKMEDFFNAAPSIILTTIKILNFKVDSSYQSTVIEVGDGGGSDTFLVNQIDPNISVCGQAGFSSGLCDTDPISATSEWIADSATVWDTLQNSGDLAQTGEEIFFIQTSTGAAAAPLDSRRLVFGANLGADSINPPIATNIYPFNALLNNWHKVRYNYFRINGNPRSKIFGDGAPASYLVNERTISLKRRYKIEAILSYSDFDTINTSPEDTIGFYVGSTFKKGWIQEMEYEVVTGKATIELLTE